MTEYDVATISELREVIGHPIPRLEEKITAHVDALCAEFIANSPIAFVATSHKDGRQTVSPKGDAPGFVKLIDETTLLIPERSGNKLAFGFENILTNSSIALIFLCPGTSETIRISGQARISKDPKLLSELSVRGKPAVLCTIVTVEECWYHCGKALMRSKLWDPESWLDKPISSYVKQVAETLDASEELVGQVVKDDYEQNL